jgi:hypothetical protein
MLLFLVTSLQLARDSLWMMPPHYSFTVEEKVSPPLDWCLPGTVALVDAWEAQYGRTRDGGPVLIPSDGCQQSPNCPIKPETLAAKADAWLRQRGIRPVDAPPLPLDVYTLARNVRSEFGSGTAMEKLAIAWVAVNRTLMDNAASITEHLLGTFGTFGRQVGSRRPASTQQDPSVADLLIANHVYTSWKTRGTEEDPTFGAVSYFDKVSQDAMHAKAPDSNPAPLDVYDTWTGGGNWLTWIGHVPDIRPYRLLLFSIRKDLRAANNNTERARIRNLGRLALLGQNRAPRADWCQ